MLWKIRTPLATLSPLDEEQELPMCFLVWSISIMQISPLSLLPLTAGVVHESSGTNLEFSHLVMRDELLQLSQKIPNEFGECSNIVSIRAE